MSNARERTRVRFPRYFVWGWGLIALAVVCVFATDSLGFTGYWSSDPPMTLVGLAGMVVAGVCAFTGVLTLLFGGLAALLSLFMSRRSEEQRR